MLGTGPVDPPRLPTPENSDKKSYRRGETAAIQQESCLADRPTLKFVGECS